MDGVELYGPLERRDGARRVTALAEQDPQIVMALHELRVELDRRLQAPDRAALVAARFLVFRQREVSYGVPRRAPDGRADMRERDSEVIALLAARRQDQMRGGPFRVVLGARQDRLAVAARTGNVAGAEPLPGPPDVRSPHRPISHGDRTPAPSDVFVPKPSGTHVRDCAYARACPSTASARGPRGCGREHRA